MCRHIHLVCLIVAVVVFISLNSSWLCRQESRVKWFEAEHQVHVKWEPQMEEYQEALKIVNCGKQRVFYLSTHKYHAGTERFNVRFLLFILYIITIVIIILIINIIVIIIIIIIIITKLIVEFIIIKFIYLFTYCCYFSSFLPLS